MVRLMWKRYLPTLVHNLFVTLAKTSIGNHANFMNMLSYPEIYKGSIFLVCFCIFIRFVFHITNVVGIKIISSNV